MADRGGHAHMARRAARPAFESGLKWNAEQLSAISRYRARYGRPADRRVPLAHPRPRLRRLCDQHDPTHVPATWRRPATTTAVGDDDRRRTEHGGRQLGVVLGWVVECGRRCRRTGLDQWRRADLLGSRLDLQPRLSLLSAQAVPVPPQRVQLLRILRARYGSASAPARRAGIHPTRQLLYGELPAQFC